MMPIHECRHLLTLHDEAAAECSEHQLAGMCNVCQTNVMFGRTTIAFPTAGESTSTVKVVAPAVQDVVAVIVGGTRPSRSYAGKNRR